MRQLTTRLVSLFMIFAVVTAGFAGGAAATEHTTTLAGDGTDEVTGFTADSGDYLEHSVAADGTDFDTDGSDTLHMNVTFDGEEYTTIEAAVDDGTTASQTLNMSHDELSDLPGDAGQSTTVTVTTWGEDVDGNVATAENEFTADITFDSTHSATTVDDDSADTEEQESGFFSLSTFTLGAFGDDADDMEDLHTYDETVGIDGANTSVTVNDATTDGTDAFDDAIDEDKEAGDLIYGANAAADGTPVLAFYEEADTDIVDENDTYVVYDGNGAWTFNTGDEYDGETEMDVFVSSQSYTEADYDKDDLGDLFMEQADMGFTDLGSEFGYTNLGAFSFSDLLSF